MPNEPPSSTATTDAIAEVSDALRDARSLLFKARACVGREKPLNRREIGDLWQLYNVIDVVLEELVELRGNIDRSDEPIAA